MTATNPKQNGRFRLPFFRRPAPWVEITGYRVGDIQLDEPIFIHQDAHITGHVIAPKITVAGLIFGSTAATETHILPGGQVWGDVYTALLQLEPGGKLHGWVCALEEEGYQQIRATGIVPAIDPAQNGATAPSSEAATLPSPAQISVLHRLQAEAASALTARAELEQSFDQRLKEVAGEMATNVSRLNEELKQLQEQLEQQQQAVNAAEESLHAREALQERQTNELAIARELLEERSTLLEQAVQENAQKDTAIAELKEQKTALEEHLHASQRKVDELTSRANSLEMALQASVVRTTEQEDALMRWQELAGATETRANELAGELKAFRLQTEENERLIEMLQEQRQQIEKEWQTALDELEDLQGKMPDLLPEPAESLLQRLATLEKDNQRIPNLEARLMVLEGAEIRAKEVPILRDKLAKLEQASQEQEDQILWHSANLKSGRQELDRLRQANEELERRLATLQTDFLVQQQNATKWQERAERVRASLEDRNISMSLLQEEQRRMQDAARRSQLQLTTLEEELKHYLHEIDRQGKELAEARSLLSERDLALQETQVKMKRHVEALTEFKQVAGDRIKELQAELSQARKLLKDTTSVLAKRQSNS